MAALATTFTHTSGFLGPDACRRLLVGVCASIISSLSARLGPEDTSELF
jgi:hypothetical protein